MDLKTFFEKLNKISIYLILFFTPLLFLPLTQNFLDFPKQFFSSILIFLSLIGWVGKSIFEGKLTLVKNKIFYFILFLIFLSFLFSLLLSPNPSFFFFGFPFEVCDNFLTLILFLVFVFLIFNSFETKIDFLYSTIILLISGAIIGALNLFQIYNIFIFPFDFAKTPTFNTIGSQNSLALFEALLLPISIVFFFKSKKNFKIILALVSIILFLNILLINFKTAWFTLTIEVLVLFIFGLRGKFQMGFVLSLMAILTLSIFFYFFPAFLPGFPNLPPEVSLSFPAETYILKQAFSKNLKNIILGTGPGTFSFIYSLYRSPLLNQTIFWGTRFTKGHSLFSDWLLTKGLLGGFILISLYFFSFFFIFSSLVKFRERDELFELKISIVSSLTGVLIASLFYPFNFSLYFLFWFLIAGAVFSFSEKKVEINFYSPSKSLFINSIFVLTIIFSLIIIFLQGQRYIAEIYYLKGIRNFQSGQFDLSIQYLQKAINFNPSLDLYWRDLAQIHLAKANFISQDKNFTLEEKQNLANSSILAGAQAINRAVTILPQNVANWNVRGFFYQNLVGIEGAADFSLDSYQKAIQLEPASPYSYAEKGRVYILAAQDFAKKGDEKSKNEYLNFAISILEKSLELKPDYAPTHYLLAVAYDQLGKGNLAISKLEETKKIAPGDWGVSFQLGILYWRANELEKAKKEFENTLQLNPNYSNAHYMLGLVFEKMGEKEKAISEFEKVVQLNPDNEEVKKILENLKKGLPPLEGISLPIQETPSEIRH